MAEEKEISLVTGYAGTLSNGPGKRKYNSYYSGTDIKIFFGDSWVDEISEIEFSMQEQAAPIYGYASYTFDKVARGNRIIQGSFAINFKEVGYLQTILNGLSSKENGDKPSFFSLNDFQGGTEEAPVTSTSNNSVETIISGFDTLAQGYEDALWGKESDSTKEVAARKTDTFFYGTRSNANNKALRDHGFNILLTYGQGGETGWAWERTAHGAKTAQTIVGVQLTGVSQRVDPSGNPVQEVYSFIAKDISGNVTKGY